MGTIGSVIKFVLRDSDLSSDNRMFFVEGQGKLSCDLSDGKACI